MTVIKKLRHIELTTITEITDIDTSTEQLFLDHNQIGTLPKNIDRLENLQILDLSYNNLVSRSSKRNQVSHY